jgi:hypothetical protein
VGGMDWGKNSPQAQLVFGELQRQCAVATRFFLGCAAREGKALLVTKIPYRS